MITREHYLQALDVVETYHRQLREVSGGDIIKKWNDLKIGDKIIFTKSLSKNVLTDKEYEVIDVKMDWKEQHFSCFTFICENGIEKTLNKHPRGYRVRQC